MKCQFIYVIDRYLFQKVLDMAVDTMVSLWNLKTKVSSKPIAFHDNASWPQELPILQGLEEGNAVWQNEIRLWSKVDSSVYFRIHPLLAGRTWTGYLTYVSLNFRLWNSMRFKVQNKCCTWKIHNTISNL